MGGQFLFLTNRASRSTPHIRTSAFGRSRSLAPQIF